MGLITILLYALAIYMVFRTMMMSKRTKKNRILIDAMHSITQEDVFFEKINAMIETEEGSYKTKAQIIKLWGMAYHERYARFEDTLNEINMETLMLRDRNGNMSIQNDEDSFIYMYLAIPEMLYTTGNLEERNMMREKLRPYEDFMKNQIVYALSEAMDKCFEERDDEGLTFCENLLAGEYGGYIYSKSMIGLYKSMAGAQAMKVYKEKGDTEKYEELVPMVQEFAESGIGKRWVKGLKLDIKPLSEEENEDAADGEEVEPMDEDLDVMEEVNEETADIVEEAEEEETEGTETEKTDGGDEE